MKTFNDIAPNVLVLNLLRRPKIMEECKYLLDKYDIKYQRFDAIDGELFHDIRLKMKYRATNGALGCSLSHINMIKHAKMKGWETLCVLEDDITINSKIIDIINSKEFKEEFPKDWDFIKLSSNIITLEYRKKVYDHNKKIFFEKFGTDIIKGIYKGTGAYLIKNTLYDKFLSYVDDIKVAVDTWIMRNILYDNKYNCYSIQPNLFLQNTLESDICEDENGYWGNITSYINQNYTDTSDFECGPNVTDDQVKKMKIKRG